MSLFDEPDNPRWKLLAAAEERLETAASKTALDRTETTVDVDGRPVRVKVARLGGRVVNAQPEHDDVVRVAGELALPVKVVLARAAAAAAALLV